MCQQMANRDVALAVALESWNVGRDRIRESHATLLHEPHYGRRRSHDLGQGGEVENRVERHRLDGRDDGTLPVGFLEENLVTTSDEDDRSRRLLRGDRLFDQPIDAGKTCRVGL